MRRSMMLLASVALVALGCGSEAAGSLTVRANGINEARAGIAAGDTADGWAVEFDHAVLVLSDFRLRSSAGDDAMIGVDPVAIELVPEPAVAFEIEGIPAQRWDRASYHVAAPSGAVRSRGVDADLLSRMRTEGWSTYYAGRFVAPADTVDSAGDPVDEVPFEFGFPVEVDYEFCIAGNDGTEGVVIPNNSAADYEITWHLTHLFFDSFVEDAALRVEPLAARWNGSDPVGLDDLDVPLGGLRGMDGGPLVDEVGNPVIYIPGMSGADTLRDFVVQGRPGHFNGLEGFCMTTLAVIE